MVNSIFTNRRAVRNFSSESISDDEIKSLIAAFSNDSLWNASDRCNELGGC